MTPLWIFLGGGSGAVCRYLVATVVPAPWGTWMVNVLGSMLLAGLLHPATGLSEGWRFGLGTGFMGGFTTYSTFNLDVWGALVAGEPGRAALIATATFTGCLLGAALGWALAGTLGRP